MLKHKSLVLSSRLVVAAVALLPLTEAAAQLYSPPPDSPTRSCFFDLGSAGNVRIIAGPVIGVGTTPDLTAPFPVAVTCPSGAGKCLRWDYRWIYTGPNPSHSVIGVDADVKVFSAVQGPSFSDPASPTVITAVTGDNSTGYGINKAGEIGLRFNANAATYQGSFFTPVGIGIGTVTAGYASGNRRGFCAIVGADNPFGDPLLSSPITKTTNTLGCTVDWTLSADGCVVSAVLNPASQADPPKSCSITFPTIGTGLPGGGIISATCGAEISVPGSSTTCSWSSTLRKNICVTVP